MSDPGGTNPPVRFDENTLRNDIVRVWGEYGAHVDMFDHIAKLAAERDAAVARADAVIGRIRWLIHNNPNALSFTPADIRAAVGDMWDRGTDR